MLKKIAEYLAKQLDIAPETVHTETTFESLGVDSLDTVEMIMDLEEDLGIELELEEKLTTVGELVAFIEAKIG